MAPMWADLTAGSSVVTRAHYWGPRMVGKMVEKMVEKMVGKAALPMAV